MGLQSSPTERCTPHRGSSYRQRVSTCLVPRVPRGAAPRLGDGRADGRRPLGLGRMAPHRQPGFRGRASECQVLDGLLENVRGGQSAALVIRGEAGVGKTALLRYAAGQASEFRVVQLAGVEAEMELPVRRLAPAVRVDGRPAASTARASAGCVAGGIWPLVRRCTGSLLGRAGDTQFAVRGCRRAAACLLRRRRPVARRGHAPGAGVRGPTPAGRVGRDRLRGPRTERRGRTDQRTGTGAAARVAAHGVERGRCGRPAGGHHPGPARSASARPDHWGNAGQPAGPAGAVEGDHRSAAGRWLWASERRRTCPLRSRTTIWAASVLCRSPPST